MVSGRAKARDGKSILGEQARLDSQKSMNESTSNGVMSTQKLKRSGIDIRQQRMFGRNAKKRGCRGGVERETDGFVETGRKMVPVS